MSKDRFRLVPEVHVFLRRGEQVLLLRRYNTGYEDGNYSVLAGHMDGGEEVKAAAIREAWEEAGIHISPDDLQVVGVMHRMAQDERISFFLAATRWTGEVVNREPHKCDDLSWFDLDSPPHNVIPYIRRAIENYQACRFFDTFGWAK